jgi:hypothetical protein
MKWLYVTVALLSASVCLVAWVYLRERETSSWHPSEEQFARADAATALTALGGAGCGSRCAVEQVNRTQPRHWLIHLVVKGQSRCLQIDLDTFVVTGQHGLYGVQPSRCASAPS